MNSDSLIELGLDALATFRITRLITTDRITRAPRVKVIRHAYEHRGQRLEYSNDSDLPGPTHIRMSDGQVENLAHDDDDVPELAAFIVCPWCVGMWVAFGVIGARVACPRAWAWARRPLALSAITGLLASV